MTYAQHGNVFCHRSVAMHGALSSRRRNASKRTQKSRTNGRIEVLAAVAGVLHRLGGGKGVSTGSGLAALLLLALLHPATRGLAYRSLGELTGAHFVATITPGLSGSEAGVGVTNSKLCCANVKVAAELAARDGTTGPLSSP